MQTLFGAMMALLDHYYCLEKRKQDHKEKRKYFFRPNTFVFGFFFENDFKVNCLA